jgi:hypothetical protein
LDREIILAAQNRGQDSSASRSPSPASTAKL